MNAVGTKTAHSNRAVATIGLVTSLMARLAASGGESPRAILRSTFSTTTMASSTTMPMASTRPKSDRLLIENPNASMAANVPISETGTAASGMIEARQVCRKMITTITTRKMASSNVWTTASIECRTNTVGS